MAVTFKSKHAANILMLDTVAMPLIKMMGHSGTVPGAIAAEDIATALDKLRAAVAKAGQSVPNTSDDSAMDERTEEPAVPLAHRALPLVAMLEAAVKHGDHLIWER